jgi:hypothetical protein
MSGYALRWRLLAAGLLGAATASSLLLVLYTASYAVWLTAHPMYSDAVWGRRFILCAVAAAGLVVLAGAALIAHVMHRDEARRWLLALLLAADVATVIGCVLIHSHRP